MDQAASNNIGELLRERVRLDQELDRYQRMLAILFVDIVGSTRFFDQHGNTAGLVMVQKCLDLLSPIIEGNGGIIVKTIGDAILARFDGVERCIRGAVQMVRSLQQRNRGRSPDDEIHVHVGINYGPCLVKDNDVFGDVVNVAARIEGATGSDEIVISPSVYEQIRQLPDIRVRKKSIGVELKGKASKLDLYTVVWLGDESAGPALPPPTPSQVALATGLHTNLAEALRREAQVSAPTQANGPLPPSPECVKFSLARVCADGSLGEGYLLDHHGIVASQQGDVFPAGDPLLDAQHVRFSQLGGEVYVEDLGCPQGVYLRLREPHRLRSGDTIQIGLQRMRFVAQEQKTLQTDVRTVVLLVTSSARPLRALLFKLSSNDQSTEGYELCGTETLLGRFKGTYTFPDDPYVSGRHARITLRDDQYFLEDLGSTNGTFVRIRKCAFAREGDTLLIGKQLLRVLAERAANPAH